MMPRLNRGTSIYAKLPEALKTKSLPEARLDVSLNATYPKGIPAKKVEKFLKEQQETIDEDWKVFIKKQSNKALSDDED